MIRLLVAVLALPVSVFAGGVSWEIRTLGGYDSNPAGYAGSGAQGVGWTQVTLGWSSPTKSGDGKYSLTYTGSVYSFVPESDWSAHQHKVSAQYTGRTGDGLVLGASAAVAGNWNHPTFSAYSYHEFLGSGWLRTSAAKWPFEAQIKLSSRTYPESPAFDFRQVAFELSGRHQWPTRTTLRMSASYMARTYPTTTIDDLIAGRTQGSSNQYYASALLSQGLTEKTGLRLTSWLAKGKGESRWREDYWQVLDDPLAATGFGGRAQVSCLAPAGTILRPYVGGQWLRQAYVTSAGEHDERTDRLGEAGLVLEGLLPWTAAGRSFSWSLELNGTDQRSDDPDYAYRRLTAMFGLKYAW